jgi:hypothetical protein
VHGCNLMLLFLFVFLSLGYGEVTWQPCEGNTSHINVYKSIHHSLCMALEHGHGVNWFPEIPQSESGIFGGRDDETLCGM